MPLLTVALAWSAVGHAQSYPNRAIRLVVPFAAGGGSDALARLVGQKLNERFGQPVVIDNRAGAGGNLGTELVAKSVSDGYIWCLGS
jgi:tripartite-type tricarboxylate transporter receptor subunit TctC